MAAASDAGDKRKRVMAGHLEEVDIFSVAQFLMLQSKTGILEMKAGEKTGTLFFEQGQVINAQDDGGGEPEEIAFRLFQWKSGDFDFFATEKAVEKKIEKDTQTLLFELAVRMDEESAEAAEQAEEAPAPEEAAPREGAAAPEAAAAPGAPLPMKAKAVAPTKAVARLVNRPKGVAVAAAAGAPDMTETQFMQAVQDRLSIFVDELPDTTGREWRQERAAAGTAEAPSRKIGIGLSVLSVGILVILIILVLKNRNGEPPVVDNGNDKNHVDVDIKLPPSYTFVTAPFTPEREAEDAVRKIDFKCEMNEIDVIGDKLEKAIVVLRKGTSWDTAQLKKEITHDAAHVINNIFSSPNCQMVQSIDLRVKSRVGFGTDLKWSDVLIVEAERAKHKPGITIRGEGDEKRFLDLFHPQFKLD